jgi:hypothetical protein
MIQRRSSRTFGVLLLIFYIGWRRCVMRPPSQMLWLQLGGQPTNAQSCTKNYSSGA